MNQQSRGPRARTARAASECPPAAQAEHLAWEEVARIHRTRWGISIDSQSGCARSILTDVGFSGYRNQWVNARLHYQGEGRKGNQEPVRGNAALLAAKAEAAPVRVFEKRAVNDWADLGDYVVVEAAYDWRPEEGRRCFEFVLTRAGSRASQSRQRSR